MQDVHIKNSIPLDVANTLGFAIDLRYPNLAKANQWEENQAHFMQLIPLCHGPAPAGMIKKKYA